MKLFSEVAEDYNDRKVAVMFLGNPGAGKSTLLSQMGGTFEAGFSMVKGVTTDVLEQTVIINDQPIILVDSPGLYAYDEATTKDNSRKLSKAFKKEYYYKLFFVVTGTSRGIVPEDMALMSRVNEAISHVDRSNIKFRLIVNQIRGKKEYDEYEKNMIPPEKLRDTLSVLSKESSTLPINFHIDDVLLLRSDESKALTRGFYDQLMPFVMGQWAVKVRAGYIKADQNDAKVMQGVLKGFLIGISVIAPPAGALFARSVIASAPGIIVGVSTLVAHFLKKI